MTLTNIMGEVEDCIIFGITSLTGRAILFHAIMENGAMSSIVSRLAPSFSVVLNQKKFTKRRRLDELELVEFF